MLRSCAKQNGSGVPLHVGCAMHAGGGVGGRARDESALRVRVMQRCAKQERCARERRAKGRVCKGMGVQGMSVQSGGGGGGWNVALSDLNSLPPPHSVVLHGVLTPAVVQRARRGGGALCNERAMSALSVQHAVDVRRASQRALSVRRAMSVQRVMSVQRATRVRRALHCALR